MDKEHIESMIRMLFDEWCDKNNDVPNKVRYSGPKVGKEEYQGILDALFNNWWSGGKFTTQAEKKLATISERSYGLLANSGSSANLLLMSAAKELYFKDGDKILTLACGFPTTVNPIVQAGLVPYFIDIDLDTLNANEAHVDEVLSKNKDIKGIFLPHTLGFVGDLDKLLDIARKHNVIVFFDACDAYDSNYKGRPVTQYGRASTFSFYVAHHATMGEGGGIVTNNDELQITMKGFRNWGKYCASPTCCDRSTNPNSFCPTTKLTKDNLLPDEYGVNYVFEWMGYNLKPLELQSSMLMAQLDKLPSFRARRIANYNMMYDFFNKQKFEFKTWKIDFGISPFAFPILLPADAPFTRKHLVDYLKRNNIESRMLFAGNLAKHPAYQNQPHKWDAEGALPNSNLITDDFLMLGVSHVCTAQDMCKIQDSLRDFFRQW
jgi:CDP-6-deoxy-D-xylo-4-hexulose-3-dehydrase